MTRDRVRKARVRARMAITGERFTVANRALDDGRVLFQRMNWARSPWGRLLPTQAPYLEFAIATATVNQVDGELEEILSRGGWSTVLPDGVATALTWTSGDEDDETLQLKRLSETSLRDALRKKQLPFPLNVGELAEVLASLGFYQHNRGPGGVCQWRADPDVIPDPGNVLSLPVEWLDREDHVQWILSTGKATYLLREYFSGGARPPVIETTVQRLASETGATEELVRLGLDGMIYRGYATVARSGVTLSREQVRNLALHARFAVNIDWTSNVEDEDDSGEGPDDLDDFDLNNVRWTASPWSTYQSIRDSDLVTPDAVELIAHIPFGLENPIGRSRVTLAEMASGLSLSLPMAVKAFEELEDASLFAWDGDAQLLRVLGSGDEGESQ